MANYKIQLGVQLDKNAKSQIDEQLKKINVEIGEATLSKKAIKSIQSQLSSANLGITIDTSSVKEAQNEVNKLVNSFKKISDAMKNTNSSKSNADLFNQRDFDAQKNVVLNKAKSFWKEYEDIAQEYGSRYKSVLNEINNASTNANLNSSKKQLASLMSDVKLSNSTDSAGQAKFLANQEASLSKIRAYMNQNTKAAKQYGQALAEVEARIKNATNTKELQLANTQFNTLKQTIKAVGQDGKTFGDQFKNIFTSLSQIFSAGSIITNAWNQVKSGFNELVALDDAMVELKKVTDETANSYKNFYHEANSIAKQLGSTTQEVITQTANWGQLGYAMQDAIQLAKESSILSTISPEMNIDDATETLISTMKAYNIDTDKVRDEISSKINVVGNNFAIDNSGIAEALKRSSAAMAAANNTLDENIALIASANEIIQDPASVGTALKTVSMRIRANVRCPNFIEI